MLKGPGQSRSETPPKQELVQLQCPCEADTPALIAGEHGCGCSKPPTGWVLQSRAKIDINVMAHRAGREAEAIVGGTHAPPDATSSSAPTLPSDLLLLPLRGMGSAGCPFPRTALCKGISTAFHSTAAIPGLGRHRDSPGVCPLSATLGEALAQLNALPEGRASSLSQVEVTYRRVRVRNPDVSSCPIQTERRRHFPNSSSTPECQRLPPACPI